MLTSESKQPYLTAFKQMRAAGAVSGPVWLEQMRQAGIASFDALGFPTLKNEDWKYTNIEALASESYVQPNGEVQSVSSTGLLSRALVETDAPRLVFVNGAYVAALSSTAVLPQGLRLGSLAEFIKQDDGLVAHELGRHASAERQHFVALNTAFLGDGAVVALAPGCRPE